MDNWDWNKLIPSLDFHTLALVKFPGWEKPDGKEPAHLKFELKKESAKSSRDIAIEFDNVSHGVFWYRDFTDSGIPILRAGESYQSMFVFQYQSDCDTFKKWFSELNFLFT